MAGQAFVNIDGETFVNINSPEFKSLQSSLIKETIDVYRSESEIDPYKDFKETMNAKEAAKMIGVSERHFHREVKNGHIKFHTRGTTTKFYKKQEIINYIEGRIN